jgi:protein-tyrosine phosphatase
MDSSNLENVLKLAKTEEETNKVSMILDTLFPGEKVDVPDPYYGGDDGFDRVYDMLDQACDVIATQLR